MGWTAIIGIIIDLLVPFITGWLKDWLNKRLQKAAAKLPILKMGTPSEKAKSEAAAKLLDATIKGLRPLQFVQRGFLRHAKAVVVAKLSGQEDAEAVEALEDSMMNAMQSKALFLNDAE